MNFNTSVFEPALKFRWVIFCLLFGLSLSSVALKPSIDRLAIALLHLTSDQRDESAEIIVVAIDEATLDAIDHPWPWPRQYYGEMLYRLEQLGINEAGFDLQFIGSLTSDGDAYFAEAIDQFGHVVLASDMVERSTNFFTGVMLMEPLPTLLDAGAVSGSVGVDREIDGVVRYPPTYRASFSEQLARGRNNSPPQSRDIIRYRINDETPLSISALQLFIENGVRAEDVRNKIAIIGWDTKAVVDAGSGQVDKFMTPFSRFGADPISGVQLHAQLLRNRLTDDWVRQLPAYINFSVVSFFSLLGFAAVIKLSILRAFTLIITIQVLALLTSILLWSSGQFFNALLLTPTYLILLSSTVVHGFLTVGKQKRELRKAFDQYVSPSMIEELVRDPQKLQLGGNIREMTIMFCDIRGFTTISERFKGEPNRLAAIINRLLTQLTDDILKYGGTVDKYMGDCIMAFWNAPIEQNDHADRAVRSAVSMYSSLLDLNQQLIEEGLIDQPMRIGVGIGTGDVVVGNMGSEQRFDYTVLGDTVNMASRLEGLTKQLAVTALISQTTFDLLDPVLRETVVELDKVRLKGKKDSLIVHGLFESPFYEEEKDLVAQFLNFYREGSFHEGLKVLDALDTSEKLSPYAGKMKDRLRELIKNESKWDGVYDLTIK